MIYIYLETDGSAPHSMVSEMIEKKEDEAVIKSVAGTTYAGVFLFLML